MSQHRLVLLDESRVVRECLASAIAAQSEFTVVHAVADMPELLRVTRHSSPRVALVSLDSLRDTVVHALHDLKQSSPSTCIVGMGVTAGAFDIVALIRAGAAAFVMKDAAFDQLLAALRSAADGSQVLPVELTRPLFSGIADTWASSGARGRITAREGEIVDLIVEGFSNKDIARELNIAVHTVKTHVHNILEKLDVRTRLQLAALVRTERALHPKM
jgi:two-component system nitrate/nitrite response regulator NarL